MQHAGGTHLPLHVMDEFVIMRLAEMIQEGVVDATIDRILEEAGPRLTSQAEKLKSVLSGLRLEERDDT
jgi:hypothetical protein